MKMSLKPSKVNFVDIWSRLKATMENVINVKKVNRKEWTERFSDVYKICVAFPEPLCDQLYSETKDFIDAHVTKLHEEVKLHSNIELLICYHKHWINYKEGIDYMNELYSYLNTQYIRKQKYSDADITFGKVDLSNQKLEINELGLYHWEKKMITPLKDKLIKLLLQEIENDRLGKPTNQNIIKNVIYSLVDVESYKKKHELYENAFEKPFLEATGEYYDKEAELLIQDFDCSKFMEKVLDRLTTEEFRCQKFLHSSSYAKVREECENKMIAKHIDLLHGQCKNLVLKETKKDLKNMYKLLKNIPNGLTIFTQDLQNHIAEIGLKKVSVYLSPPDDSPEPIENAINFVENILKLHDKYSNLITEVFNKDQQFCRALDKACSTIINFKKNSKLPCRSPELMSKYCDFYLKKSASKGIDEIEIGKKLSASIIVFRYIDDKDVFQKFYSKMLGKRLIHSKSVSMDCEESMINKLKRTCGHEFTSKLHRMFTDIKVSNDLIKSFAEWCSTESSARDIGDLTFNIYVLQAGAWPLSPTPISPFEIPLPLEKCVSNFEKYYYYKFNGRRLTWLHFLSSCDLRINLNKKSYLVTMGTFFMAILLLFEDNELLSYENIKINTKLSDDQLSKHLHGLVEAKLLIHSGSNDNSICLSSIFKFNEEYTNKRTKFKINAIVQKEISQQVEVEQTHASVDEDRKLYLQAAIVRIMKTRKIIKHNLLVQEVIQLSRSRFIPNVPMIKKCIETLIDKQYLERTSNTTDEYSYIA